MSIYVQVQCKGQYNEKLQRPRFNIYNLNSIDVLHINPYCQICLQHQ